MTRRQLALWTAAGLAGVAVAWLLFVAVPRWYASEEPAAPAAESAAETPGEPETRIKATVYYVSEDGMRLVGLEREVPFAQTPAEQARHIVEAQLEPPPAPLIPVVPEGTKLRALYATDRGEAFVDLSGDVVAGHPGGSLSELYTVYALVNSLTTTLPGITAVQILVEGQEVDTLAGHVDLRRPLQQNLRWVAGPTEIQASAEPADQPPPNR